MLDSRIMPMVSPLLTGMAKRLDRCGITPNQVTVAGFVLGLLAIPCIIVQSWYSALLFIAVNRLFDGLDGALARYQNSSSSAGGYLDICFDFLFYAAIPLAFGISDPELWALPALLLVVTFIGTGSSFLAFAIASEKWQIERVQFAHKSFHYMQGLTEGTETIALFVAFCLWPEHFVPLAYIFALLCTMTIVSRVYGGYHTIKRYERTSN